jgi:hypothetical protein
MAEAKPLPLAKVKGLKPGTIITDTTDSAYKIVKPYDNKVKLGDGSPDAGYIAKALRGRLVSRGHDYHVPFVRIAEVGGESEGVATVAEGVEVDMRHFREAVGLSPRNFGGLVVEARQPADRRPAMLEAGSVMQRLKDVGPPDEWSGAVAAGLGKAERKELSDAWEKLSEAEKKKVRKAWEATWAEDEPIQLGEVHYGDWMNEGEWYHYFRKSDWGDQEMYFYATQLQKNGNMAGVMSDKNPDSGRWQKAKKTSINKLDMRSWKNLDEKDVPAQPKSKIKARL